jgi:hypothetical protein
LTSSKVKVAIRRKKRKMMSGYTNWVGKKFNAATAAAGNAVGGAAHAVGNGVSNAGRGAGNAVSGTTRTWADGLRRLV